MSLYAVLLELTQENRCQTKTRIYHLQGIPLKGFRQTGDEIAMQLNAMSVPTARGGKWYGKTVLNAANRL